MIAFDVHPFLFSLLRGHVAAAPVPAQDDRESWSEITHQAARHGLTFMLYRWIGQSETQDHVPPAVFGDLRTTVFRHAARNLLLGEELIRILEVLELRQIPCAPIRGVALAEQLFHDRVPRCTGDIDLLVPKERIPAVGAALVELGYQEVDRRPGFAQAYSYTLEFIKDLHGWVTVEPHWTIAYPPFVEKLNMERVWTRCERGRVLGMKAYRLAPGDLVLHLCLHLIHQGSSAPLSWYWELDQVIRQEIIDWGQIVDEACMSDQEQLVGRVFQDLYRVLDTPIPAGILNDLYGHRAHDRRPTFSRSLAALLARGSRMDGVESFALFFTLRGPRARLKYLWSLLFPSVEFMRIHYGIRSRRGLVGWHLARVGQFAWEGIKGLVDLLPLRDGPRSRPLP
jgi:hypothetical protein